MSLAYRSRQGSQLPLCFGKTTLRSAWHREQGSNFGRGAAVSPAPDVEILSAGLSSMVQGLVLNLQTCPTVHHQTSKSQAVRPYRHSASRPFRSQRPAARTFPLQTVRASSQEVSTEEQGQISAQLMQSMKASITESLVADKVEVVDVYGDGRHVSIEVVSKLFEGQTSVKRQRLVYKAIWQELQSTVHAVDSMKTSTPAEASGTS